MMFVVLKRVSGDFDFSENLIWSIQVAVINADIVILVMQIIIFVIGKRNSFTSNMNPIKQFNLLWIVNKS